MSKEKSKPSNLQEGYQPTRGYQPRPDLSINRPNVQNGYQPEKGTGNHPTSTPSVKPPKDD
ncbi:hypothetical protein [Arcobacter arenosus]|uniref:hypothetical protein n=1 Tax=Arcobacter arenosus TaxID=2576037 RepID=UPI003BA9911B